MAITCRILRKRFNSVWKWAEKALSLKKRVIFEYFQQYKNIWNNLLSYTMLLCIIVCKEGIDGSIYKVLKSTRFKKAIPLPHRELHFLFESLNYNTY